MTTSLLYHRMRIGAVACLMMIAPKVVSQQHVMSHTVHHLRNAEPREWSEFPAAAMTDLDIAFPSTRNDAVYTLILRQYDVKQSWQVMLNDQPLGSLVVDEQDMQVYFAIPAGTLLDGENKLRINTLSKIPDDIRVGPLSIDSRPAGQILSEARIDITVMEKSQRIPLPSRITVTRADDVLQTLSSPTPDNLVIRPGCVYTADGKASLTLPAGTYIIYAGRGFEYGIDSVTITLRPGDHQRKNFFIAREVDTRGWISADTHVHTFTHSGHGDASSDDRVVTLAGEGIELPVITDHNVNIDLTKAATENHVRSYFTLVTGDELTTKVGHFNVFPTDAGTPAVDSNAGDWNMVVENIRKVTTPHAVILNHARDIHNGFRPFDPTHHLSSVGISTNPWSFPATAMEVINSGSQQSDRFALYRDWFGMINRGHLLVPVGSSDAHDVNRYTVGQGRTYIQANDDDPSSINVDAARYNFQSGRVMVSLGLLTTIKINNRYGPGDLVPSARTVKVEVSVLAPTWTTATRVMLYANGVKIREQPITPANVAGIKWHGSWDIRMSGQDVCFVAIAEGPGGGMPFWNIAKPYQPTSIDWTPHVMGSTGGVWVDADTDGNRTSAYEYATEIWNATAGDPSLVIKRLRNFDEAVASQMAALYWKAGTLSSPELEAAVKKASPVIRRSFKLVREEVALLRNAK